MEIIKKNFDGIEYYLIDIYDEEFSFGTVYHFAIDIDDKYCFFEDNTYIPIENKKYLKKIKEKLEINTNIIYKKLDMDLLKVRLTMLRTTDLSDIKDIFGKIERLNPEEEYKVWDEASKTINELYPDISYEDTMNVLDDGSGIYFLNLPQENGNYNIIDGNICLNSRFDLDTVNQKEQLKAVELHESIHKLTNRNGYIKNNTKLIGLIEGGTEKICENKYGDKTSHTIGDMGEIGESIIHVNFSQSTYPLQQVIYRQMGQLVDPQLEDKALINGNFDIFLKKFEKMYGKGLSLYLSNKANLITKDLLPKKNFKQAQKMLLTKAFDKKMSTVKNEEDMVNYMTELRNFEYYTARIDGDTTFETYYRSKYNDIIDLATKKGIDLLKIEEFEYSPVEFYPLENGWKCSLADYTEFHIDNLAELYHTDLDFKKCTRIQIKDLPNFDNIDVILQDGIPISSALSDISKEDNNSSIYEALSVDCKKAKIYSIFDDGIAEAFMIVNSDGTSEVRSKSNETSKVYKGTKNQIDLGITLEDIKDTKRAIEFGEKMIVHESVVYKSPLGKLKAFFSNLVHRKENTLALPNVTSNNITDKNATNSISKARKSFLDELNPDNEIYSQDTIEITKKSNKNDIEVTRGI